MLFLVVMALMFVFIVGLAASYALTVKQAKAEALARHAEAICTFEAAADEWREHSAEKWSANYAEKVEGIIRRVLLPWLGKRPIADITEQELLYCLQRVEKQGLLHTQLGRLQDELAIIRGDIDETQYGFEFIDIPGSAFERIKKFVDSESN